MTTQTVDRPHATGDPFRVLLGLDDRYLIEVRQWDDGRVSVWWADGPGSGEATYASVDLAMLAVAENLTFEYTQEPR